MNWNGIVALSETEEDEGLSCPIPTMNRYQTSGLAHRHRSLLPTTINMVPMDYYILRGSESDLLLHHWTDVIH